MTSLCAPDRRVTTRDPLNAATRSAYGYTYNNPLNGDDPSGLAQPGMQNCRKATIKGFDRSTIRCVDQIDPAEVHESEQRNLRGQHEFFSTTSNVSAGISVAALPFCGPWTLGVGCLVSATFGAVSAGAAVIDVPICSALDGTSCTGTGVGAALSVCSAAVGFRAGMAFGRAIGLLLTGGSAASSNGGPSPGGSGSGSGSSGPVVPNPPQHMDPAGGPTGW